MRLISHSAAIGFAASLLLATIVVALPPSPVAASSKADQQRGAELFSQRGCAHCHGVNGIGGKRGPDLQAVRKHMSKDQMRAQIHDGGMMMPAFGSSLTSPQIEDLIAYLRAKHRVIIPAPQPATDALTSAARPSDVN